MGNTRRRRATKKTARRRQKTAGKKTTVGKTTTTTTARKEEEKKKEVQQQPVFGYSFPGKYLGRINSLRFENLTKIVLPASPEEANPAEGVMNYMTICLTAVQYMQKNDVILAEAFEAVHPHPSPCKFWEKCE